MGVCWVAFSVEGLELVHSDQLFVVTGASLSLTLGPLFWDPYFARTSAKSPLVSGPNP